MKKINLIIVLVLSVINLIAQAPDKFSYQAVIRDSDNNLVKNKNIKIQISILKGTGDDDLYFVETHTVTTNENGLVSLVVGEGTPVITRLIDWSSGVFFVKTEVDIEGGTNYTITSKSQLLSVPYALFAEEARNTIWTTNGNNIYYNKENVGIGLTNPVSKLDVNGTIGVNDNKITGVANPENGKDAANKDYVDDIIATNKDYVDSISAVNKDHVDALINQLSKAGAIAVDIDGNVYPTVRIGSQIWMAENLKTTRLNDGTAIPLVTENDLWANSTTPAYCWYDNTEVNKKTYGALYNWYVVTTNKLCPTGWHVPSRAQWTKLENFLIANGYNYDGTTSENKIGKSLASSTNWKTYSGEGTVGNSDYPGKRNATGFNGYPEGLRDYSGFNYMYSLGLWWTFNGDNIGAYGRVLTYTQINLSETIFDKNCGLSVRCLK